jgi:thioredoxin-related protein
VTRRCLLALALALVACAGSARAAEADPHRFDDRDTTGVTHPAWFKESFLDLRGDLRDARRAGKRGVAVYFGTRTCSYCRAFIERTLAEPDIVRELRAAFDIVGLEIFSDLEITDPQGRTLPVKAYAVAAGARFTPTQVFYGVDGAPLARIVGYYPPERFRAVLEYLRDGHAARETLAAFMARRASAPGEDGTAVVADPALFARPPYLLDRRAAPAARPLLVVFERPGCAACARLHRDVLGDPGVRALVGRFEAVRLDATDDRPLLLTPAGRRTSARAWTAELGVAYAPALVFFDERGVEVLRLDSEVLRHRMRGALEYVLEKAYVDEPQFQRWRRVQAHRDAAPTGARQ